jgi:hypothetical protein
LGLHQNSTSPLYETTLRTFEICPEVCPDYSNITGIPASRCTIVNNTLYLNDSTESGSGEFAINYHTTNKVFENNILFANAQGLLIGNTIQTATGPRVSVNTTFIIPLFGNTNSQWIWNNHTYNGLAAFVRATQNDLNSQFADPDFVDAATNNFHLTSSVLPFHGRYASR